jgi:hypothetical protein
MGSHWKALHGQMLHESILISNIETEGNEGNEDRKSHVGDQQQVYVLACSPWQRCWTSTVGASGL